MKARWINSPYDGEPDENGDYVLVIENNAGNRVSTFKGKNEREIIEQLLQSQVQANRQIGRLMKPDVGKPPTIQNKEFTPADNLRFATSMTDPDKVADTVTEIMSARQADTPVGKFVSQQEADRYYKAEAMAFMAETPEYYPNEPNKNLMVNEMFRRKLDFTRNNMAMVYYDLADELEPWPDEPGDTGPSNGTPNNPAAEMRLEDEPRYQPQPVTPQPMRNYSTSLRSSDATASKPTPRKKPVVTRDELQRMSRADLRERLRDPIFRQAVDALA